MFLLTINSIKKRKIIVLFAIVLAFFALGQTMLAADDNYGNYGLNDTLKAEKDGNKLGDALVNKSLAEIIGKIVGAALAFIGILFFLLIIYGGFLWMTARGNEQQVEKAKELIIAATIGLVIVLAAYAITAYIGSALTGGEIE